MKRIFIGGLGRSGTTIALNALYRHEAVYAVPIETKFLVEEDGFADLIAAMTDRFSVAGAAAARQRFEHLMRRQVPGLDDSKFRQQHTLSTCVFQDYDAALDGFISLIQRRRYFPHREPLLAATRRFVADTFDGETIRSDKAVWAEKTPSNIWRIPFLRELWPDCIFVHALRDPRAILLSLRRLGWLPPTMLHAVTIFQGDVAALLEVRRRYRGDPRFIEMRLEEVVADTQGTLGRLAAALGIAQFDAEAAAAVTASMARYYASRVPAENQLSPDDRDLMVEVLRPAVIELGYPSDWEGSH